MARLQNSADWAASNSILHRWLQIQSLGPLGWKTAYLHRTLFTHTHTRNSRLLNVASLVAKTNWVQNSCGAHSRILRRKKHHNLCPIFFPCIQVQTGHQREVQSEAWSCSQLMPNTVRDFKDITLNVLKFPIAWWLYDPVNKNNTETFSESVGTRTNGVHLRGPTVLLSSSFPVYIKWLITPSS